MSLLEDLFFFKRDMEMVEQHRKMKELKATKEAVAKASGIRDEIVLDKLIAMNVRPEEAASLSIAPLVLTAWSDGGMQPEEKEAILQSIKSMGRGKNDFNYTLLEKWLEYKPDARLLDAWKHYVEGLCKQMTANEIEHLRKEIITHAELIARASGGIMGIAKISGYEEEMINKLKDAFEVCK